MRIKSWVFVSLLGVFVCAFILRIYKVTQIPPSLNWDEVSIGYNAYSILKTGKDEWGQFLPLHFKSYGEYKLPAQVYASIPGIYLFGLNEFGLRITPVIYGSLTVLLLYFLAKKLTNSEFVGLASSFFLAISPWHIQLTRVSFESSFSVFWVLLGLIFLVYGFEKPKLWIFATLSFAISIYTYNSARVFTPLFIFVITIIYRKDFWKFKKYAITSGILLFVLLTPLIPFVLSGEAKARYKLVSITDEAGLVPRINERRGASTLPPPLPRLIHNKVTYISFYFVRNYLAHFSPNFLFISGAPHKQHHVQGIGELYLIQAPYLIFGLYILLKSKNKFKGVIFGWILITFVPVAATQDSIPNALRTVIAAPAFQILVAIGLYEKMRLLRNKKKLSMLVGVIFSSLLLISILSYLHNYYKIYPISYSQDWQYGNKEVVQFIKENYDKYDLIVYSRTYGEPHMFTLFYLGWDPKKFQTDPGLERFETFDWVRVLRFDKFYFPDLGDVGSKVMDIELANPGKKILFIGKKVDFPDNTKPLKEIKFLDGSTAFYIVETK